MGWFSSFLGGLTLLILYAACRNMYDMMNPLAGVNISPNSPLISNSWRRKQEFSMFAFFSESNQLPKRVSLAELKNKIGIVLLHQHGFVFNNESNSDASFDFEITSTSSTSPSASTASTPSSSSLFSSSLILTLASRIGNLISPSQPTAPAKPFKMNKRMWKKLQSNNTSIYLHVLFIKKGAVTETPGDDVSDGSLITPDMLRQGHVLAGVVNMIKYDKIPKSFSHRYLLSDFGWANISENDAAKAKMSPSTIISYWKPEVCARLVVDFTAYPYDYLPHVLAKNIVSSTSSSSSSRKLSYLPPIHVDEIGLTTDKYIPLNDSINSLSLKFSYSAMSLQRWLFSAHMEDSLKTQKEGFGFADKDLDDVRRLITDTSVYLLVVTFVASFLHFIFEILAFQSDISFWRSNKSLAGLSCRQVVTDLISQTIIFLFLLDSDTSPLVTIPAFLGLLVQGWKVNKATGVRVKWSSGGGIPIPMGVEFSRWSQESLEVIDTDNKAEREKEQIGEKDGKEKEVKEGKEKIIDGAIIKSNKEDSNQRTEEKKQNDHMEVTEKSPPGHALSRVTLEADELATTFITRLLVPISIAFILRSLIFDKHASWYSWAIGSLTGCVYSFGFVFMFPQLYINHKLKSVSYLPWRVLAFKFVNTFIDDLFSFIIKMPTMHRLSVFRDDIVFFIYLYQRHIYAVDESRPIEK